VFFRFSAQGYLRIFLSLSLSRAPTQLEAITGHSSQQNHLFALSLLNPEHFFGLPGHPTQNPVSKNHLLSLSANALKLCTPNYDRMMSFETLHPLIREHTLPI
jgi:hypothetical protein